MLFDRLGERKMYGTTGRDFHVKQVAIDVYGTRRDGRSCARDRRAEILQRRTS